MIRRDRVYTENEATPTIRAMAIAMCHADGDQPYDEIEMEVDTGTTVYTTRKIVRWTAYIPDAKRLQAGMLAALAQ